MPLYRIPSHIILSLHKSVKVARSKNHQGSFKQTDGTFHDHVEHGHNSGLLSETSLLLLQFVTEEQVQKDAVLMDETIIVGIHEPWEHPSKVPRQGMHVVVF